MESLKRCNFQQLSNQTWCGNPTHTCIFNSEHQMAEKIPLRLRYLRLNFTCSGCQILIMEVSKPPLKLQKNMSFVFDSYFPGSRPTRSDTVCQQIAQFCLVAEISTFSSRRRGMSIGCIKQPPQLPGQTL